jgi:Lar family restriction alleviation protein
MQDELKACPVPWCGGDVLEVLRSAFGHNYFVKCQHCGAAGPAMIDKAEAVTAWNTRADPALASAQAEVAALQIENARLRQVIADEANRINIEGSAYHLAQLALNEIVTGLKQRARAALVQS